MQYLSRILDAKSLFAIGFAALMCIGPGCGTSPKGTAKKEPEFAGVTLTLNVEKDSPVLQALQLRIPEWEARSGASVKILEVPTIDGSADLAACNGTTLAQLEPRKPFSAEFKRNSAIGLSHIPYLHQSAFGSRNEQFVAFPLGVHQLLLWYRADLFSAEKWKNAFEAEKRRPLAVPKTWVEYAELAEFFQKSGAVKFGCVEPTASNAGGIRPFFARATAYTDDARVFPVDISNGKPLLNSPPAVRGLELWLRALATSPANGKQDMDEKDCQQTFLEGNAVFLLAVKPPTADPTIKITPGFPEKIGVAALPMGDMIYDLQKSEWTKPAQIEPAPYLGHTGYYLSISSTCANPAAAESLVAFLSDAEEHAYLVQGARHGLTPIRDSLLTDSGRFAGLGLPAVVVVDYFALIKESLRPRRWATDLRVSGADELVQSLAGFLKQSRMGAMVPAQALKEAQSAWEKVITARGAQFLNEFRLSQGFSPRAE